MLALLLPLLERFCSAVLALASRVPAWCWLVLALGLWGWHWQHVADKEQDVLVKQAKALANAQAAVHSSEQARTVDQALQTANQQVSDELSQALQQRDAAARTSAQRLRDLANAKRANAALAASLAACRSYGGPAVDVVPGAAREALVDLARDADAVTDQLAGCQAYIKNVVQPTPPGAR